MTADVELIGRIELTGRVEITGCAVATCDAGGTEHSDGHVAIEGNRIVAVGPGDPPPAPPGVPVARVDGSGCLVTPGLVNTHHHLYQWLTRGLAVDATLFRWLTILYPVWAHLDADLEHAAARAGLAQLALSGCTTSTDHHYLFPRGAGDLLAASVDAARSVGVRFAPARGSMDRGRSAGGLPPDEVVEDLEEVLAATEAAIDAFHDPSPDAMVQVGVAPCSPFSVSSELLVAAADLARRRGVRLHTHLAETLEEEERCRASLGMSPVEYADSLGWLGPDVWLAHAVHLSDGEVARLAATGTGVAHCPSSNSRLGAGAARTADLLRAGAPVGLGVDGSASAEVGQLAPEMRQALYTARVRGGPTALGVRQALRMATVEGARCLGREADLGSLEPGRLADVALWRLDGLGHAGIADPVAALVLGPPAPLALLLVDGREVVRDGGLARVDEQEVSAQAGKASRVLAERAGLR